MIVVLHCNSQFPTIILTFPRIPLGPGDYFLHGNTWVQRYVYYFIFIKELIPVTFFPVAHGNWLPPWNSFERKRVCYNSLGPFFVKSPGENGQLTTSFPL